MPQDQSYLRFSVEESVWFQTGQQVAELLSISLEPNISIREHDQYVSIKGALQLSGEYKMEEVNEEINDDPIQFTGARFVHEVETREDGISELFHKFPVDITIPRNRVTNLEDIYVIVESFDYDFPEERCLKLIADLAIIGINEEQSTFANEVDEVNRLEEEDQTHQEDYNDNETVTFDPFDHEDDDNKEYVYFKEDVEDKSNQEPELLHRFEQADYADDGQEATSETLSNIFLQNEEEDSQEYSSYTIEAKQESEHHDHEEKLSIDENFRQKHQAKKQEEDPPEKVRKNDNALYLTKLFTRDDEEEFMKLKMCIVQQGETIDEICERYDIPLQQLIRINNLGADPSVYEGQILYIPNYIKH